MKKNISDMEAFIRLWAGFSMLGVGIARDSSSMTILGSGKIAEGLFKYCPVKHLFQVTTKHKEIFAEKKEDITETIKETVNDTVEEGLGAF
ncbi:Protein of unknown function [Desulfonispora thiosulfatigenes DSM 11270]|uniref:Inner membrane protein YgaP-like transmembrane domain-containing protein n=1 Tax=Desulfonispora thiosulfatigenes DSM 11270 TaxID=656914 RepID=A0A1W1UQ73_DESTI|nr:DUF2892 domain-containing protein [Desulfonispora thiosulfatigenes]SMB83247.1 Protein of unknown function [Desulfonispora thiosulfatigenes DSM 11270]